jgi:hypothetical protein
LTTLNFLQNRNIDVKDCLKLFVVDFNYTITIENIAQMLHKNCNFKIIEDPIIKNQVALEIPAEEAFSLSLIQGATYLVRKTGISFRDRMEVFIHRSVFQNNKFIYSPGLFGRDLDGNLRSGNPPLEIFAKFPSIKEGKKFLLFRSTNSNNGSNIEYQTYMELKNNNIDPKNFMIFKFSDNLTYLEPFFEYLSCKAFDNKGYFTESQTPWFQQSYNGFTGGIPDYSCFYIEEFDELKKRKLLPNFMTIQNLSTLFTWKGNHDTTNTKYSFFIGEAKSSKNYSSNAYDQLTKYSKVELAESGYATLYNETQMPDDVGLVNISKNFEVKITDPKIFWKTNPEIRKQDREWISNYAKVYLLSNLPFENICEFICKKNNFKTNTKLKSFDLLAAINKTEFNEIVDLISM